MPAVSKDAQEIVKAIEGWTRAYNNHQKEVAKSVALRFEVMAKVLNNMTDTIRAQNEIMERYMTNAHTPNQDNVPDGVETEHVDVPSETDLGKDSTNREDVAMALQDELVEEQLDKEE